jgi:hypothetical protein
LVGLRENVGELVLIPSRLELVQRLLQLVDPPYQRLDLLVSIVGQRLQLLPERVELLLKLSFRGGGRWVGRLGCLCSGDRHHHESDDN